MIPRKLNRSALLFILAATATLLTSACNGKATNTVSRSDTSKPTDACRDISHAMGSTCVPISAERIIVLDPIMLDAVLSLDEKPVGAPLEIMYPALETYTQGIANLGDVGAVKLEQVLQLEPDLILGLSSNAQIYPQLSQIAPTILRRFEHSGEWKANFSFVGEVLGKMEQVEQVMDNYYQRIHSLEKQANNGDNLIHLTEIEVSVVRIYSDRIATYTRPGFIGTVLEDAGLARPYSQDLNLEETMAMAGNPIQYYLSKEVLDKADGDAIFVIVGNWNNEIDTVLADLKADPLWSTLEAVQRNAVYEVGDHWTFGGPIAANAVIDDLSRYLLGDS